MENASKALIIAASVLIAILVIAFGIRIYRSTTGSADQLELTTQTAEMVAFNGKFSGYAGNNKSAAEAKALAGLINANNANSSRKIALKIGTNTYTTYNDIMGAVANITKSCTITLNDINPADGYLDTVVIAVNP